MKLRQFAVTPGMQGQGIGKELLRFSEAYAREQGFRRMTMHARKTAVSFYERTGYRIVSPEFTEVTIPHFRMEKDL